MIELAHSCLDDGSPTVLILHTSINAIVMILLKIYLIRGLITAQSASNFRKLSHIVLQETMRILRYYVVLFNQKAISILNKLL